MASSSGHSWVWPACAFRSDASFELAFMDGGFEMENAGSTGSQADKSDFALSEGTPSTIKTNSGTCSRTSSWNNDSCAPPNVLIYESVLSPAAPANSWYLEVPKRCARTNRACSGVSVVGFEVWGNWFPWKM